jgi:hypothetical protein
MPGRGVLFRAIFSLETLGLPPDDDDDDDAADDDDAVYLFLQKQQIAYQHIPIGLDHVDQLPRRAWISSNGDSGSTPLKCVDSLP